MCPVASCQYKQPPCEPGSNVTLKDSKGQPILDEDGNTQTVPCNDTKSVLDQVSSAVDGAGQVATDTASAVDDASGGAVSSSNC